MKCTLMHKEIEVVDLDIDPKIGMIFSVDSPKNQDHLPAGFLFQESLDVRSFIAQWWQNRSIPMSRNYLPDFLMQTGEQTPKFLIEKSHGLSLSDQYWMKASGFRLEWKDINFFDHAFSEDVGNMLMGQQIKMPNLVSPDNTSDGWLQKKWTIRDGKRVLMKGFSEPYRQEPVNEVIASCIVEILGIKHIPYTLHRYENKTYSLCENFITKETELVPASQIVGPRKMKNQSLYEHLLERYRQIGIRSPETSISEMILLDFIIGNTDRHYGNFGVVRSADTLEYIGTAPIFDSGTSLWHNVPTEEMDPRKDIVAKTFEAWHSRQIKLVKNISAFDLSKLEKIPSLFAKTLKKAGIMNEERIEKLAEGLEMRVKMLKS